MQMFKQKIEKAVQGDRVGLCVTQFDPTQLQRGVIASPNTVKIAYGVIANVNKIRFYKFEIAAKSRFHGKCHVVGFFLSPLDPLFTP